MSKITSQASATSVIAENGKRERERREKQPHPPTSSGHCASSVVLSDGAQAQGAQGGKEQWEGEGSGVEAAAAIL